MDEVSEALNVLNAKTEEQIKSSRELQTAYLQYIHKYQDLVDHLSDDILVLPTAMDVHARLKQTQLRLVVSVAVAASVVGVLAIWWAAWQPIGFPHDLLEAAGAALITFALVEVFLHWLIEIPSKAAQKAADMVETVKELTKKATDDSRGYLEAAKQINAELAADLETSPKA